MRLPTSAASAALILAAALQCGAAQAQQAQQPVTDRSLNAKAVAQTPLRDLNVKRDGIPAALAAAARDPYALQGVPDCAAVAAAVQELDGLLGPDFDAGGQERRGLTAGKVAESAVGSLVPFRGLLREASGAASAERQLQAAILAGATRRGFLKGLGAYRGCAAPAKPAGVQGVTLAR